MADVRNIDQALLVGPAAMLEEFSHSPATWQPPALERARVFATASSEISNQSVYAHHRISFSLLIYTHL
jgi:hypothetical protein